MEITTFAKKVSMNVKEVIAALESVVPLPLQEDWDNSGLQVGLTEADVAGVLLCLDVTEAVVDEAIQKRCNLIVSHHPLIFKPLRSISDNSEVERCVIKALKYDIAIVSMHTNADNSKGGVNFKIAEKLHLLEVDFITTKQVSDIVGGSGVIGTLPEAMSSIQFIQNLKNIFGSSSIRTNSALSRQIKRVAICGGAGAFLLNDAISMGADAFITGEMHYHDFFNHVEDIQIAVFGHYESEQFTIELFDDILSKKCPGLNTHITRINTNPIKYY